jgi:hypothetical protein
MRETMHGLMNVEKSEQVAVSRNLELRCGFKTPCLAAWLCDVLLGGVGDNRFKREAGRAAPSAHATAMRQMEWPS